MFFCLGNICRSPVAEGVFLHHIEQRGLGHTFHVESSGTSAYHVGEAPDPGSREVVARRLGADISGQRAQQLTRRHLDEFDVLVAMDGNNRRDALAMRPNAKILLLRDFDPADRGADVPDPWGGGISEFERVFDIVNRSTLHLIEWLLQPEEDR
ncbi:MAG: low molecular weight protein-tyrosine-phosphatase [bacterium]